MPKGNEQRQSSLPPSLHTHLYSGPRDPQPLSPTNSAGVQEEAELRASPFDPSRPPVFPLRPLVHAPLVAPIPDPRHPYPLHEAASQPSPVGLRPPARLPSPERFGGPSSLPHVSRYQSQVLGEPVYSARPHLPAYQGSHSLPTVFSQPIPGPAPWREGEAGPSSLAHSYEGLGRRISPAFPPPQQIHRRATEPGGYPLDPAFVQPGLYGERLRLPEDRPRAPEDQSRYQDTRLGYLSTGSNISLPPLYSEAWPPPYGSIRSGEREDLPPLYNAIPYADTKYAADDGVDMRRGKRRADPDFEPNPRPTKKITLACYFCRQRKLKCDGNRPTCGNCHARIQACSYADHLKRRGPGKAAKGTKVKKRVTAKAARRSEPEPEPEQAITAADNWDGQTLVPEPSLRSERSMDSGFHVPPQPASPERTSQLRRRPKRGPSPDYRSSPPSDRD